MLGVDLLVPQPYLFEIHAPPIDLLNLSVFAPQPAIWGEITKANKVNLDILQCDTHTMW